MQHCLNQRLQRLKSKYPNSEKHKNQTEGTNHAKVIFITEHKPDNTLTLT